MTLNKLREIIAGLIWKAPPPPARYLSTPEDCTFYESEEGLYTVFLNGVPQRKDSDYRIIQSTRNVEHYLIVWSESICPDDEVTIQ